MVVYFSKQDVKFFYIFVSVAPLQSLVRNPVLPCTSVIGTSQLHTLTLQPSLCSRKAMIKPNTPFISQSQPSTLLQNVQQFSVTSKNMAGQGHDHSRLWTIERGVALGLLGLVPVAFIFPSTFMDNILAITIVMHNHWYVQVYTVYEILFTISVWLNC